MWVDYRSLKALLAAITILENETLVAFVSGDPLPELEADILNIPVYLLRADNILGLLIPNHKQGITEMSINHRSTNWMYLVWPIIVKSLNDGMI